MNCWNLDNKILGSIVLWRMDANTFWVVQAGHYTSLLSNGNYILLHKKYSSILDLLQGQVEYKPVIITDRILNTSNSDYIELTITNEFHPSTIETIDDEGKKIWCCAGYLFVSGEIRKQLEEYSSDEFKFTLGFSNFGGSAA